MYVKVLSVLLLVAYGYAKIEDRSSRTERSFPGCGWPRPLYNNTATGLYNSVTEKCCMGSVSPNKKPSYDKCCGEKTIDSTKEVCCDDVAFPITSGQACCGKTTFNTDDSICCDGKEAKVATEAITTAKCCGDKAYNPLTEACCTDYNDEATSYRTLPTTGTKTSCCGEQVYDPSTETCCGKTVIAIDRGCCGNADFDTATHTCCDEELKEISGKMASCCGKEVYDDDAHICSTTYSSDGNATYALVAKTDKAQTSVCGTEPYDSNKQICCPTSQKLVTKTGQFDYDCCGDESFSYNSGVCCNDVLHSNVTSMSHECCAGELIDRTESSCCGSEMSHSMDNQLCCSVYDSDTANMTYSVVDNPEKKHICCGLKGYDTEKERCCGDTVVPMEDNTDCCGSKTYDLDKEVCCGEQVFPKGDGRDTCCYYGTTDKEECSLYPYRYPCPYAADA